MIKRRGFSLVEILIVMGIVAILVVVFTGAINPLTQIDKANDSKRKKDLDRIKIAFEDYYNDRNCYPDQEMVNSLNQIDNCGKDIFSPWLKEWPCDPEKTPYSIVVEESDCPDWFKVYSNLANRNDSDIPKDWYEPGFETELSGGFTTDEVNFGKSSTNVLWYERRQIPCTGRCMTWTSDVSCDDNQECFGEGCYVGDCHRVECQCNHCQNSLCLD